MGQDEIHPQVLRKWAKEAVRLLSTIFEKLWDWLHPQQACQQDQDVWCRQLPIQDVFDKLERWVCGNLMKFNKVSWFQPRTEIIFCSSHEGEEPGAIWAYLCCYSTALTSLPGDWDKGFSLLRRRWAWPQMEGTGSMWRVSCHFVSFPGKQAANEVVG